MFIAGSTYAESNASTGRPINCPIKINMVFFFFVETYPIVVSWAERQQTLNYELLPVMMKARKKETNRAHD